MHSSPSSSRRLFPQLASALLAAVGCNTILGNEGGGVFVGAEGGASSGAASSSGSLPGTSSGGTSSGGAGSSGTVSDGGAGSSSGGAGCTCTAGCVRDTALCNTEEVFGPTLSVQQLAANDAALYKVVTGSRERCDYTTGTCFDRSLLSGQLATPSSDDGTTETVYFLGLSGIAYGAVGGNDPVQVMPPLPVGAAIPAFLRSGSDFVYAFMRREDDGTSALRFIQQGQWGQDLALPSPILPDLARTASTDRGVFVGAAGNDAAVLFFVPTQGAVRSLTLSSLDGEAQVGLVDLAASNRRLFVAGRCIGSARVCSVSLDQGEATNGVLTPVLEAGLPVERVYADGGVLFWTESLASASQSHRCLAADCEATREDLGGPIVAFTRNSSYVYYALSSGPVRRVQRTP